MTTRRERMERRVEKRREWAAKRDARAAEERLAAEARLAETLRQDAPARLEAPEIVVAGGARCETTPLAQGGLRGAGHQGSKGQADAEGKCSHGGSSSGRAYTMRRTPWEILAEGGPAALDLLELAALDSWAPDGD